jgi:hypothetical protein
MQTLLKEFYATGSSDEIAQLEKLLQLPSRILKALYRMVI